MIASVKPSPAKSNRIISMMSPPAITNFSIDNATMNQFLNSKPNGMAHGRLFHSIEIATMVKKSIKIETWKS